MTMDAMVRYLESCGFKADKKYDPDTKSYRFTIERGGRYLVRHFKWLNCDAPWLHQKQFLDSMANEFEKESKSDALMTSLFGKPSSKWTDPKTGKEFGYSWGFDRVTGDFSDYVKNDIQSTSYVSDIINKIIHEKEKEEMSNCIDRVKWRVGSTTLNRTPCSDDKEILTVVLKARPIDGYTFGYPGPHEIEIITNELENRLNGNVDDYKRLVNSVYGHLPSTKLPAIEKVIFNDPATIIIWKDETKTVVKCQKGDTFDPEKGFAMAVVKKVLGNQGNYCETVKKWTGSHRYDPYHSSKWLATQRLYNALGDKKATKTDLKAAMEEAVKYLEGGNT